MGTADFLNLQETFFKTITESSGRLAAAWAEALRAATGASSATDRRSGGLGWLDPAAFLLNTTSAETAQKFWEFVQRASADLPLLLRKPPRAAGRDQVKQKWLATYGELLHTMFGIPERTETQRLMDETRRFLDQLAKFGPAPRRSPAHDLFAAFMPPSVGSPYRSDRWFELLRLWTDPCGWGFRSPFSRSDADVSAGYRDRLKALAEAQLRLLGAIPELQDLLLRTARAALEKTIEQVERLPIPGTDAETKVAFSGVWLKSNEEALGELFSSQAFGDALAKAMRYSLERRNRRDDLVAEQLSCWNIANGQEVNKLSEAVTVLTQRIRVLEDEVRLLKSRMSDDGS